MKFYFVYILKCSDLSYYTGMTSDLEKRVTQHKDGKTYDGYTSTRRPVELIWYATCNHPKNAIKLEKQIKGWSRKKKEALINGDFENLVKYSKNYTEFGKAE